MKQRKLPIFYICLIAIVVLVIVFTEIGKFYLKDVLTEYENSQYKYVAEDFFENNFISGNAEALATVFSAQIPEYETKESFGAYLSKITSGKDFKLQHVSSGLSDEEKYNIDCGDDKFATFVLEKSNEKSNRGFDLYRPSGAVFNENLLNRFTFEIPFGYSLKINDLSASDNYITDIFDLDVSESFEGIESIKYVVYSLPLCEVPVYEVKAPTGEICEITKNDDGAYRAEFIAPQNEPNDNFDTPEKQFSDDVAKELGEKLSEEYSEYVIEATKAYACYMQKDATFGQVSKYLDKSSMLYENLRTSPNWMVIDHVKYWFEDEKAFDFYAYSDDIFSCRITVTQVLRYSQTSGNSQKDITKDYRDYIDITWFLHKVDGKYLIYDSFTH